MNTKPPALSGESPKPRKREPRRPRINPRGESPTRWEAMEAVTRKTDLLVVGDQDIARLAEVETMSGRYDSSRMPATPLGEPRW